MLAVANADGVTYATDAEGRRNAHYLAYFDNVIFGVVPLHDVRIVELDIKDSRHPLEKSGH